MMRPSLKQGANNAIVSVHTVHWEKETKKRPTRQRINDTTITYTHLQASKMKKVKVNKKKRKKFPHTINRHSEIVFTSDSIDNHKSIVSLQTTYPLSSQFKVKIVIAGRPLEIWSNIYVYFGVILPHPHDCLLMLYECPFNDHRTVFSFFLSFTTHTHTSTLLTSSFSGFRGNFIMVAPSLASHWVSWAWITKPLVPIFLFLLFTHSLTLVYAVKINKLKQQYRSSSRNSCSILGKNSPNTKLTAPSERA